MDAKARARWTKLYQAQCLADVDTYNRALPPGGDVLTINEARKQGGILKWPSLEGYLMDKVSGYAEQIAERLQRAQAREDFLAKPATERYKLQAIQEMCGVLRVHGANLLEIEKELEAEMELEMDEAMDVGCF